MVLTHALNVATSEKTACLACYPVVALVPKHSNRRFSWSFSSVCTAPETELSTCAGLPSRLHRWQIWHAQ